MVGGVGYLSITNLAVTMLSALLNFLTLRVENVHPMTYIGLAVIWILLLSASISSLQHIDLSKSRKLAWLMIIVLFPVVGLGLYCVRCLFTANWSFLDPIFSKPKQLLTPSK